MIDAIAQVGFSSAVADGNGDQSGAGSIAGAGAVISTSLFGIAVPFVCGVL